MERYHPAMVTLHWLLAIIVLFLLLLGGDIALKTHLLLGVLVGGLFIIRLGIKLYSTHPSSSYKPIFSRLSNATHYVMYGLVFAVILSGTGVALEADLLEVIRTSRPLPQNYSDLAILNIHKILTKILLVVVCSHILAAFFHQFILADALFSRMWFGRR